MSEVKTKPTTLNVKDFLSTVEPAEKRADGLKLLTLFEEATGEKAVLWGTSIVGFGKYHYKSTKSSQEADWMLVGFSPRKQNLSVYIMAGNADSQDLFAQLGKHKSSKGCLYLNKLADVDLKVLAKLIKKSYAFKDRTYS